MRNSYVDFYRENNFYPTIEIGGLTVKYNLYYTDGGYDLNDDDVINEHRIKLISIDIFNDSGNVVDSLPVYFISMDFFKQQRDLILSAIKESIKEINLFND
jgi:hypothetical protein